MWITIKRRGINKSNRQVMQCVHCTMEMSVARFLSFISMQLNEIRCPQCLEVVNNVFDFHKKKCSSTSRRNRKIQASYHDWGLNFYWYFKRIAVLSKTEIYINKQFISNFFNSYSFILICAILASRATNKTNKQPQCRASARAITTQKLFSSNIKLLLH